MIDTVVKETWSRIRDRLREEIGERFYEMWFDRSSILGLKRGVLSIGVPNLFIREWVEEHYGPVLDRLSSDEIGAPVRMAFRVDPALFREMRKETERIEEVVDAADPVEGKTLDSFVLTPGNEMAVRALRHVAAGKQPSMNPLVMWGPEGVGKSHMATAVSSLVPEGTTLYRATGEEFARRFAWNLKTRKISRFREQVGGAGILVLDDAQELSGKSATQRELASLVQDLKARGGQFVAFLDRHPKEVPEFEEVFRSVLISGMLQSIDPPVREEALRILEGLLASARRRIPTSVVETVVDRCGGSVARLDRLIRKVYAFAGLTGEPVDEAFLDRHLDEIAGPSDPEERRLETILALVEEHFDIDRQDLLSKRKTKVFSIPRGLVVYMLREHAGLTYKEIGRQLGDRSHTSVYLMYKKYSDIIPADPDMMALVREAGRRLISAGG